MRLGTRAAYPALRLTPAAHAQQVVVGSQEVERKMSRSMAAVEGWLADATHRLQAIISEANNQVKQRQRDYIAVVLGFGIRWPLTWGLPGCGGDADRWRRAGEGGRGLGRRDGPHTKTVREPRRARSACRASRHAHDCDLTPVPSR